MKDKASNNGTPSEFESVVKSVHGSMSVSASASTSASTSTSDAVSTEASEFVSAVNSLSQVTSNGS
ncbi:TPA: hypothetical protein I1565_002477, partial [Staphylococcus pseudintermedius]|nr:hypothetical protein [Staphylococcus pseudintermedius]